MGHGSSPVKIAPGSVAGVFSATEVFFVMPGEWEIWIQLKEGTKVFDQAKIDYKLYRASLQAAFCFAACSGLARSQTR